MKNCHCFPLSKKNMFYMYSFLLLLLMILSIDDVRFSRPRQTCSSPGAACDQAIRRSAGPVTSETGPAVALAESAVPVCLP